MRRVVTPLLQDLVRGGRVVRVRVTGHSMSPFIRSGDTVQIEPLVARVRFGDVVAAVSNGRLLIHRLVSFGSEPLATRGDVALLDDTALAAADLLGRVTVVVRGGQRVRLGLGVERILLAWLSRLGLLRLLARLREKLRA